METYIIMRRSGWATPEDLEAAAARSREVGEDMAGDVCWLRSYVMKEPDGRLGTVCVYLATSEDKLREHADCAKLPIDEVRSVADTVLVNPDP